MLSRWLWRCLRCSVRVLDPRPSLPTEHVHRAPTARPGRPCASMAGKRGAHLWAYMYSGTHLLYYSHLCVVHMCSRGRSFAERPYCIAYCPSPLEVKVDDWRLVTPCLNICYFRGPCVSR